MTTTRVRRRAVLNLRDDRPAWALPADAAAAIAAAFSPDDWDVIDIQAPVSGRGDGGGVSDEARAAVRAAEVWIGYGFPRALLDAHRAAGPLTLRWIHTAAAGVRSLMHPELVDAGVVVTNAAGIHAEPIADTVLAAVLHFARGFDFAVRAQQRGEWDKTPFERGGSVRELAGACVGIVGYGGIGRAVARRAHALGMDVRALRRTIAPDEPGVHMHHGSDGLDQVVRSSDYLVLCLPSTSATEQLIDAARIARMPAHAVLINVGRGDVVDAAALADALAAHRIRGAALDVFEQEPLPPASRLWTLDNTLILPHVSATTPHFWARQTELIVDNIRRYLACQPLRNQVDLSAGY